MLAELKEIVVEEPEAKGMPSLNHSFICAEIIEQLLENKQFRALPELTLNIGNGITPDICVYQRDKIKPDFLQDFPKYTEMPILAIEVISASQNIQDLLDKSKMLVTHNVKAVWTVEPFTNTIFVTTQDGIRKFTNQTIENEGIKVDFQKIFG